MAAPVGEATSHAVASAIEMASARRAVEPRWYALWTRSHAERLVHDQLAAKGFRLFLPMLDTWSRRRDISQRVSVPMFPGYLFVRHALDKASDVEIRKTRGLVAVLGDRWDRRAVVPDAEIDAIRTAVGTRLPILPYPYLREGQRVRIIDGPMTGVEGLLVRTNPTRGLLVLSVEMVHGSVAVEIDCTRVAAV